MEPLYGRDDVLAKARSLLDRAFAGAGQLLLFTGEPGIGKSRLAEQVAAEASARGALVAWGRCWEAGGAPAYWPWIQVFRELEMDQDPFSGAALELGAFAPEARFDAFDRAVRSLRARAAERTLVLVLDDLHAADPSSLLLLLLLARELSRSRLLVVGAYRDAELRRAPELAALLAKLAREAVVLPLARLAREHVTSWLQAALQLDRVDAGRAAELYQLTEGQPLFVVEALRLGRRSEAGGAFRFGPHALLEERLARLAPDTRAVLEVAAVLGREFSLAEIAATAESELDRVHVALKEALAGSIVVPAEAAERVRFSHVLLRDHLYAELAPSARAALHVRAGDAILARGGDVQLAAHHLFEGQSAGPAVRVAEVGMAAAEAALSRLAFEDAVRLGRRALASPGAGQLPLALHGQLEVIVAEALLRLGEGVEGKALCLQAASKGQLGDDPVLFARAALTYGTELATGTLDERMIALLRGALAALPEQDSALRARVLARLCAALTPPAHPSHVTEIMALMRASLAMARRVGDPHALLYVLQFAATVGLTVPERERFALLEETLTLARALDQPLVLLHTLPAYITQLLALGERARADALLPSYTALLEESRQPGSRVRYLCLRALLATLDGAFEEAERLGNEARPLAQSAGNVGPHYVLLTHRLALAQLRGEPHMLAADDAALSTLLGAMPSTAQYLAWYFAGTGRPDEARARLRTVQLDPEQHYYPNLWELHAAAEACVLLGDAELGAQLYPHVLRAADRMFWTMSSGAIVGPSARALGDLATLIGRVPEALKHYDAAIAFCEKLAAPLLVAGCRAARERAAARDRPAPARESGNAPQLSLVREGDVWTLRAPSGTLRLKHGKGLEYLQHLLSRPGRAVHVLELAGIEQRTGDAGPVLDAKAKSAYRGRLEALREQLADAERAGDAAAASRAEQEIAALAEQLAAAVGLGGRDRRAASDVERTRVNVQRRLKDAIDRIASADPALGRYLSAAVKTGALCMYQPL